MKSRISKKKKHRLFQAFECMGWLAVICLVALGMLLAIQIENLFLHIVTAFVLLVVGIVALMAMKIFVGMAKDLKAIHSMLNERETRVERVRRSGESSKEKTSF